MKKSFCYATVPNSCKFVLAMRRREVIFIIFYARMTIRTAFKLRSCVRLLHAIGEMIT